MNEVEGRLTWNVQGNAKRFIEFFDFLRRKSANEIRQNRGVRRVSKSHLIGKDVERLCIETVCAPIDNLQVSRVQFIANHLSDKSPESHLDKLRAILVLPLPGNFIHSL